MYKIIAVFIGLIYIVSLAGCSWKAESSLPEASEISTTKSAGEYIPYSNVQQNYSISVPRSWIQTLNNGEFTLTDQQTGAYISIWVEDYFPGINSFTERYLADYYAREGASLQSFVKESGNEIKVIVASTRNNVPITEYKYVYWTYAHIYYISYVAETSKKDELYPDFEVVYSSFKLVKDENTVKQGYICVYKKYLGMSVEYPMSWTYHDSSDGFNIVSSESGSSITLSVIDPIEAFEAMTELEYSKLLHNIVPGASLTAFSNTGATIYGNALYSDKTGKYQIENVLIDKNAYTLAMTFVSLSEYSSIDEPIFNTMLDSLRYYGE